MVCSIPCMSMMQLCWLEASRQGNKARMQYVVAQTADIWDRVSSSLASALRAVYDGTSQVCPLQTTVVAALHIHDLEPEEIYSVYVQYCIHIYLFIFTSPLLLTAALLHCITHRFNWWIEQPGADFFSRFFPPQIRPKETTVQDQVIDLSLTSLATGYWLLATG